MNKTDDGVFEFEFKDPFLYRFILNAFGYAFESGIPPLDRTYSQPLSGDEYLEFVMVSKIANMAIVRR